MTTDYNPFEDNENSDSLPCSIGAEKKLLGALLYNNQNVHKVSEKLLPEAFFHPLHRKIYETILRLVDKSFIATSLTVKDYLNIGSKDDGDRNHRDGLDIFRYLMDLETGIDLIFDIESYSSIIIDRYLRRQLIAFAHDIALDATKVAIENSATDCVEIAEAKLCKIAMYGNMDGNLYTLKLASGEVIERIKKVKDGHLNVSGLSTGFTSLDKIVSGLQNSDLLVLASRPSMGKTSLAINIAMNVARDFKERKISADPKNQPHVVFFSLEMSAEQIANRMLSIDTGIDSSSIRNANVNSEDFAKLNSAVNEISALPVFIEDTASLTITALRSKAIRLHMRNRIGFIIVDYLQLVQPNRSNKDRNRVQEIGEISRGLKILSKELNVPILALSQLSRAVEMREDKKPQLQDLRESGDIEQDADIVMSIWRPEYYLSRAEPDGMDSIKHSKWKEEMNRVKDLAEVFVLKNRNGPIGKCTLYFNSKTTGFHSFDGVHSVNSME